LSGTRPDRGAQLKDSDRADPGHAGNRPRRAGPEDPERLQIEPRAAWTKIAAVLGVDAVTVARRWARMSEERLVWATAHELGTVHLRAAVIEVECAGNPAEVAADLVKDPECVALDITSGGRDLLLMPYAPDEFALTEYLLTRVSGRPDVRRARTHLVTGHFGDGSAWRLRELTPEQAGRFTDSGPMPPRRPPSSPPTSARSSRRCARTRGCRRPRIAKRVGIPVRRARETVQHLMASKRVRVRTEVARSISGWPIQAGTSSGCRRGGCSGWHPAGASRGAAPGGLGGRPAQPHPGGLAAPARRRDRPGGPDRGRAGGRGDQRRCIALRSLKRAGHLIDVQGRRIGQTSGVSAARTAG